MTFFEQELKKLFADDIAFMDKRFIGNACYGRLDNNIRIKIRFTTCGVADQYEALKVTLLNRNEGEIDSMMLHFHDLWGIKRQEILTLGKGLRHIYGGTGKKPSGMCTSRTRMITKSLLMRLGPMWRHSKNQYKASRCVDNPAFRMERCGQTSCSFGILS